MHLEYNKNSSNRNKDLTVKFLTTPFFVTDFTFLFQFEYFDNLLSKRLTRRIAARNEDALRNVVS